MSALADDMNVPKALSLMHAASGAELKAMGELMGFFTVSSDERFKGPALSGGTGEADILDAIEKRKQAKADKDFALADRIRDELLEKGVVLEDKPGGIVEWRRG